MSDLKSISQALFTNRSKWLTIPESEKEACHFIINRMFSKKYPEKAQLLNSKSIDKISSMNIWWAFMEGKPYPKWFWSKSEKKSLKVSNVDINRLMIHWSLNRHDVEYLIENHIDFVESELSNLKKIEKQK
jgi:hypothetical protein